MKEFLNAHNNEEAIFNNMLRGARNPIECAFGRLKARWQVLNKGIDMALKSVPNVVYACFVLHNICEVKGVTIDDDIVAQQIAQDKLTQPNTEADRRYSFNTAEGTYVRNVITAMYKEHLPHWQCEHFIHQHIFNSAFVASLFWNWGVRCKIISIFFGGGMLHFYLEKCISNSHLKLMLVM